MPYIIGIALLIITVIIVGLILRKRIYDEVDRHESWKMDIMNRNTAAQLARVKSLNLSGETQEKFESWKDRWEYIITKDLPDVEEYLFDAEDTADRYRFSSAKKILQKVDQILHTVENDIEKMLQELDELLESEELSRKEIAQLQPAMKDLQKKLMQNGYQYGPALSRFESAIRELEKRLVTYHESVEAGNYIEAKQLADAIKVDLDELMEQIEEFPEIYKLVKDILPDQLNDLAFGITSMKEEGYRIEQLGFEKEVQGYKQRVQDCLTLLEKGSNSEVKTIVKEIDERIKEIYELLEKEAIAKSYLEAKTPSYERTLRELGATFAETKTEVETLKTAYYFEDSDMEKYISLEKAIGQLKNQLVELTADMENTEVSHSEIRSNLENSFEQLTSLQERHDDFKNQIYNLRKDELKAKEELLEIKKRINDVNRKLNKSNIPGVPTFIWTMLEAASDKNNRILMALEKQPLDIAEVRHALNEAKDVTENTVEQTDIMLEQAFLTEQVIQYANRYRSSYPLLAAKLSEAERLFRNYEYELALEQAATALEEIEPGALKHIEANQDVI